jgi:hypothetical protein
LSLLDVPWLGVVLGGFAVVEEGCDCGACWIVFGLALRMGLDMPPAFISYEYSYMTYKRYVHYAKVRMHERH